MNYFTKRILELLESKVFFGETLVLGHYCKKDNPHLSCQRIKLFERKDGKILVTCGGDRSEITTLINSKSELENVINEFAYSKDEEYRFLFLKEAERLAELYDKTSKYNRRRDAFKALQTAQWELQKKLEELL